MLRTLLVAALILIPLGASAESFRKSGSGYYVDKDSDTARDTDGTEPFADWLTVEVPGDYATVQLAIDSNDVKAGTSNSDVGGSILVGRGSRTESFNIGGNSIPDHWQFSTVVRGVGPAGFENSSNGESCGTTFLGDNTVGNTVVKVSGAIGWGLGDFCIDMNDAATNDPAIGIHIGHETSPTPVTKHGFVENVNIQSGSSSSIGIKIGNDADNSDTAFNVFRNIRTSGIGTAIVVASQQAVKNIVDGLECSRNTGAIGCVSILSPGGVSGGEIELSHVEISPGAPSQIGINITNASLGAMTMRRLNVEWDEATGTILNFDATLNTGAPRAITLSESRFQPQAVGTIKCIDWNRTGVFRVAGVSFESNDAMKNCDFDFNNPDATRESIIYWDSNLVKFGADPSNPVVTRTTAGGPITVVSNVGGTVVICRGAGSGIAIGDTGCYGMGVTGPDAADWDFANALTAADLAPDSVGASELANGAVGIAEHSATGTPSATTYLRGDNTWATPAGSGAGDIEQVGDCTSGACFNGSGVESAFAVQSLFEFYLDNNDDDANATFTIFAGDGATSVFSVNESRTMTGTQTISLSGTGTINGLDAIDATSEATLEAALDLPDIAGALSGGTGGKITDASLTAADLAAGSLTAADAAADLATQVELEGLTLPPSGQTDDRLVKTNGNLGDIEQTGISVDSSNNVDGVGTFDADGQLSANVLLADPTGTPSIALEDSNSPDDADDDNDAALIVADMTDVTGDSTDSKLEISVQVADTPTEIVQIDGTGLAVNGTITGRESVVVTTTGTASPAMQGEFQVADHGTASSDVDYTLPSAVAGMSACFYDNGGGDGGIIIDAASGDEILLDGTSVGAADAIDSPGVAGAGANGDSICLLAIDATFWVTRNRTGTWVDGGVD